MKVISPATSPESNINVLTYMKNNIPFSLVVVLSMLNQYVFETMECSLENKIAAVATYAALSVFDVFWTVHHCKIDFTHNYPHTGTKWMNYAAVRAFTSLLSMFAFNYFVHKGAPFNCFFPYNPIVSNIMFYLSFLTVLSVSLTEHCFWKRLSQPLLNSNYFGSLGSGSV
jgi:hypothetical protein